MSPLITIAIPTYNRAALLEECVRSALAQTYANFEVLVSDNSSTDNTAKVLQGINDRRLRVIRQTTNIGLLPNWNACLAEARGVYTAFLSDDDRLAPYFLDRCMSAVGLEENLPIIMALCAVSIAQNIYVPRPNSKLATGVWPGEKIFLEFLRHQLQAYICTFLYHTEQLRAQGGFPDQFSHTCDLASALPLLLLGKAGIVNEVCGIHSVHLSSNTAELDPSFRLLDDQRLADFVIGCANRSNLSAEERLEIAFEAKRFIARNAIGIFSEARVNKMSFRILVDIMWQWRSHFGYLRPADIIKLRRQIAYLIIPGAAALGGRIKKRVTRRQQQQEV